MVPLQILESLSSNLTYLVVLKVESPQKSHPSEATRIQSGDVVFSQVENSCKYPELISYRTDRTQLRSLGCNADNNKCGRF